MEYWVRALSTSIRLPEDEVKEILEAVKRIKEEEKRIIEEMAKMRQCYYLGYLPVVYRVRINV